MASRIEAVAVAHPRGPFAKGARRLADRAALACLARAGREAQDVDLLINAGVYREDNLAEPALASMIQEDIGANPGHPPRHGSHGTFSFDIANGGAGVLTALQLLDGFIRSRAIRNGLVVASDSGPAKTASFPFPARGGAVLLCPSAEGDGFVDFAFETFGEREAGLDAAVGWHEVTSRSLFSHGANVLDISQGETYPTRAVDCASDAARRYLARHGLEAHSVDLAIFSQSPPGFAERVRERLGLAPSTVPALPEGFENAHTAGIIAALEGAVRSGQFASAKHVLFVAVGAGIVVGLALYRQARPTSR